MELILITALMVFLIVFSRIPLGMILMLVGTLGVAALHPKGMTAALLITQQQVVELATNHQFSVLPMFVVMGVLVVRAGLANELFDMAHAWVGHFRGGLGMATLIASGGFAALSSSSAASAATMARITLPAMRAARYDQGFAAGTVAAGGTMGILIPPSSALIIYGLLAEQNIGDLFVAGILPGLVQLAFYVVVMLVVASFLPGWAPAGARSGWADRIRTLRAVWLVIVLFGLVMGGLTLGWFSATEAGGIGAGGALLIAVLRRRMSLRTYVESVVEAATVSAMIFVVAAGAMVLNQFVNLSGISGQFVSFVTGLGLPPFGIILVICLFYLILGCFLDGFAIIFLTVPIIAPLVASLGYDLIWWGIITVVAVEISLITPPVGLNVFIIKAFLRETPISRIFMGTFPYLAADVVRLGLMLVLPAIALWLPYALK